MNREYAYSTTFRVVWRRCVLLSLHIDKVHDGPAHTAFPEILMWYKTEHIFDATNATTGEKGFLSQMSKSESQNNIQKFEHRLAFLILCGTRHSLVDFLGVLHSYPKGGEEQLI